MTQATRSREAIRSFLPIAEELAQREVPAETWEAGYRRLQSAARDALRARVEIQGDPAVGQPARQVVAWSCPRCGGLEAPQPCLGICVWRSVAWITREAWQDQRQHLAEAVRVEAALRRLLHQIAFITPREGRWKDGWQALSAAARQTLEDVIRSPPTQTR